ncbi:hypothetical protein ACFL34_01350 [Candidatus Sumerlaeota bacterium]
MDQISPNARPLSAQRKATLAGLLALLAVGVGWRVAFLLTGQGALDGDEAIVGLMAGDVLHGHPPLFYTAQHYMGALQAYLIAAMGLVTFQLTPLTLKLTGLVISLAYAGSLYLLLVDLLKLRRLAWIAALLALASPAFLTLWGLKTRGGMLLVCAMGNLLLLLANRVAESTEADRLPRRLNALAALVGFAWYSFPMVVPYFFSLAAVLLLWRRPGRQLLIEHLRGGRGTGAALLFGLPSLFIFLVVFWRTFSTSYLLPLGAYRLLLAAWVAVCVVVLALERRRLTGRGGPPLAFARLLVWCTIGLSPQLLHLCFAQDLWYKGGIDLGQTGMTNLLYVFISHLPTIMGPSQWLPGEIEQHRVPYLLLFLVLYSILALSLLGVLRKPKPGPEGGGGIWTPELRRGVGLLWIHFALCCIFQALSRSGTDGSRHFLTIYTSLLAFYALFVCEMWQLSRYAGWAALALFVACHGYFSFRGQGPEMVWPAYTTHEVRQVAEAMAELEVRDIHVSNYDLAYTLLFDLGPEQLVSTGSARTRFPTMRARINASTRAALLVSGRRISRIQNILRETGISSRTQATDANILIGDFRREGQRVTLEQVWEAMSRARPPGGRPPDDQ